MAKVADITKEQFMVLFGIKSENEEGMLIAREEYDNGTPWIVIARDTIVQLEALAEV